MNQKIHNIIFLNKNVVRVFNDCRSEGLCRSYVVKLVPLVLSVIQKLTGGESDNRGQIYWDFGNISYFLHYNFEICSQTSCQ